MNFEQVLGIVRHILTFAGGFVVAKGYLDEATTQAAIGALITLGGAFWSYRSKAKKVEAPAS